MTPQELALVIAGDEAAVRRFLHEYSPVLLAAVCQHCRRVAPRGTDVTHHAEEILAEITPGLFGSGSPLKKFSPTKGRGLPAFLRQWATWRTKDLLRTPSRNPWFETATESCVMEAQATDPEDLPDALLERRETQERVHEALQRCCSEKPQWAPVLEHLYPECKSPAEIARLTGLSPGVIATRSLRIRAHLRQIYKELLGRGR